jgi:aryl carrier-like protein
LSRCRKLRSIRMMSFMLEIRPIGLRLAISFGELWQHKCRALWG